VTAAAFVLFCAANLSLFSRDTLRHMSAWIVAGLSSADAGTIVEYATGNTPTVAAFADSLAVADNDTLNLQKPGAVQLTESLGYSSPVLETTDHYVLAYDRGGYGAMLTTAIAVASKQTLQAPILFGCVSENGDYALITSEAGYKAVITVYTSSGKQRFRWATPDYYFQAAALSEDGKRLVVAGFHQDGTELESILFFRDLNSEEITSQISLGSVVPLAVDFLDANTAAVVGDYATMLVSRKGQIVHSIDYAVDDLTAYGFGSGALVIGVHSYSSSARTALTVLDADGHESDPLLLSEELQAIDYDGARLALLTGSGLTVYDSALRPLWENPGAAGARSVCLTADGSAWVTYSKQAERLSSSSDTSEVLK
ncbi:MAG: DUF5711 family protein, partial [Butyricicoccus sp.]